MDDLDPGATTKPPAKRLAQRSVELYSNDFAAMTRQLSSQNAASRPDLDDQVSSRDGGLSDQARGKRPAPQEVL